MSDTHPATVCACGGEKEPRAVRCDDCKQRLKLRDEWIGRELRRQRLAQADCQTCGYHVAETCRYYPPGNQGARPALGWCGHWLPVRAHDPEPAPEAG